jgi:hypothetical protein
MKITHNTRNFLECGGLPPLLFSEACLATSATERHNPLQNLLNVSVNRDVRLRKTADLEGLAGSFAEVEEAADVVILIEHVKDPLGFFVRKTERFDGHGFSVRARCRQIFVNQAAQVHRQIQTYAPAAPYGKFM